MTMPPHRNQGSRQSLSVSGRTLLLFAGALALSIASIGAASAASLFGGKNSNALAAGALDAFGLSIVVIIGLSSLGVLVAGIWTVLHPRPEGHMSRLRLWPIRRGRRARIESRDSDSTPPSMA